MVKRRRYIAEDREVRRVVRVGPLRVAIEFDDDFPYGFVLGTDGMGVDGDSIDARVGPDRDSPVVHVVHHVRDGRYVDTLLLLGFPEDEDPRTLGPEVLGSDAVAVESFPLDELAAELSAAPRGEPVVPATAETWDRIARYDFAGAKRPRPILLRAIDEDVDGDGHVAGQRFPWHATGRTGAYIGQPMASGAELHGLDDQGAVPASTGWIDADPADTDGSQVRETTDPDALPRARYGQVADDPRRIDPERESEREWNLFDTEPKVDVYRVGAPESPVRDRLVRIAAMVARAIGADGTKGPGRCWIEALRWMRENGDEIWRATGFTPTAGERRLIARMISDAARVTGDAAAGLDRVSRMVAKAEEGDVRQVVEEAVRTGAGPEDLRFAAELIAEVAPPGCEHVVRALKKEDVENPWAVAWAMYRRGECGEGKRSGKRRRKRPKKK